MRRSSRQRSQAMRLHLWACKNRKNDSPPNAARARSMLIIPTYNERENVAPLVARIRKADGRLPILFVDDNSPDGTAYEIRRIQETDAGVRLLQRPAKGGFESACRDGMKLALQETLADFVVLADGDLSPPPEVFPRMIALLD